MKYLSGALSIAIVGMLSSPPAFATQGYFADGYGTQSKGMAGVGYALPTDSPFGGLQPRFRGFSGQPGRFRHGFLFPRPQRHHHR